MPDANGNMTWQEWLTQFLPGLTAEANARGAYNSAQLDETRADRQARLQIANNQLKAERERIAISRGEAEANRWYREQQVALAQQEAAFEREKFGAQLGFQREQLGAQTGLGLLQLRSQLKGPGDWASFLDLGEGLTSLQPSSGFLSAIAAGQKPGTSDVAFGGQPTPASLQTLAGNTQDAQRARLSADMALAAKIAGNPGALAPNVLGELGPDRLDYLLGLAEKGGYSGRTLLDAANKAGIGQGSPWAY